MLKTVVDYLRTLSLPQVKLFIFETALLIVFIVSLVKLVWIELWR